MNLIIDERKIAQSGEILLFFPDQVYFKLI